MSETNSDAPTPEQASSASPSYDLEPVESPPPAPPPPPASAAAPKEVETPHAVDAFIKTGFGSAQVIGIAGATTLGIAAVFAAVHGGKAAWWSHGLMTVYLGLLHAGTGAAATGFVGYSLGREIGDIPLAAARMLFAVALFLLTLYSGLPLHPLLLYLSAIAIYAITTLVLFRWEMSEWAGVVGVHAFLWFLMYLAAVLQFYVWKNQLTPAT